MAIGTYQSRDRYGGKPKPKVVKTERVDTTREYIVYRVTFDNGRQILVRVHRRHGESKGIATRTANAGKRQVD